MGPGALPVRAGGRYRGELPARGGGGAGGPSVACDGDDAAAGCCRARSGGRRRCGGERGGAGGVGARPPRRAGFALVAPPVRLCTDNAVMVAWAGIERLRLGLVDGLDFAPRPRWPLDQVTG